jgi:hypothetical protein
VDKAQFTADAARALSGTLLAVLLPALVGIARVALLGGVPAPCQSNCAVWLNASNSSPPAFAPLISSGDHQPVVSGPRQHTFRP